MVEVGFVLMVLVKPDGDGFLSVCLFVIVVVFDLKTASGNGQTLGSASCRGQWRTGKKWRKIGCKFICGATTTLVLEG